MGGHPVRLQFAGSGMHGLHTCNAAPFGCITAQQYACMHKLCLPAAGLARGMR